MHSKCNAFCFQNILYYIYVEGCQKDAFYSLSFTSYRYKDLLGYNLLVQCMRRQNILPHLLSSNVSCLWWTSDLKARHFFALLHPSSLLTDPIGIMLQTRFGAK